MKQLRVMDSTGDSVVEFDLDDPVSLAKAQEVIDKCLAKGGAVFKTPADKNAPAEKITRAEQVGTEAIVVPAIVSG